jgi:hypothetical protein
MNYSVIEHETLHDRSRCPEFHITEEALDIVRV